MPCLHRAAIAIALLCTACGTAAPDPELEVGVGYSAFEAVTPGANVPMCRGPQGAQTVVLSLRARNLAPGSVKYMLTLQKPGASEPLCGQARAHAGLVAHDGWGEICGGAYCILPLPDAVTGTMTQLLGTLEDSAGHKLSAQTTIVPVGPGPPCDLPLLPCQQ